MSEALAALGRTVHEVGGKAALLTWLDSDERQTWVAAPAPLVTDVRGNNLMAQHS